ncbi:hypothetical protein, partial [Nocardia abscessus]|uniref:hypothetical protein n=1 Tax=Nocardia abscessus TaxID=120957 RepID=UPI002457FFEB
MVPGGRRHCAAGDPTTTGPPPAPPGAPGPRAIGDGGIEALRRLADDQDPLVRAAALTAFAQLG